MKRLIQPVVVASAFLGAILAAPSKVIRANVEDCQACTGDYSFAEPGECQVLLDTWCAGRVLSVQYTDGQTSDPIFVTSVGCDACNSEEADSVSVTWTVESGWSFCISIGAGLDFKWESLGLGWSMNADNELCLTESVATELSESVTCAPGTRKRIVLFKTLTPSDVIVQLGFAKKSLIGPSSEPECPLFEPFITGSECNSCAWGTTIQKVSYFTQIENLDCPPAWPTQ